MLPPLFCLFEPTEQCNELGRATNHLQSATAPLEVERAAWMTHRYWHEDEPLDRCGAPPGRPFMVLKGRSRDPAEPAGVRGGRFRRRR